MIYSLILLISMLLYVVLIFRMRRAWIRTPYNQPEDHEIPVTIIVVFRNEAENIEALLNDLDQQNYPSELIEVLMINDASADDTVERIYRWSAKHHLRVEVIDLFARSKAFKKEGIELGLAHARHENVLLTDADCRLPADWIRSMTTTDYRQLRCGPVCYIPTKTFWSDALELELISLSAMAASTIAMRKPILSNGANMAYSRKLFFHSGGFESDKKKDSPSGDDISMLRKIDQIAESHIRYIKSRDAIVKTRMPESFGEFLNQRIRWAGKTRYDLFSKGSDLSFILMVFYLLIFFAPIILVFSFSWILLVSWLVALVVKWMADMLYFKPILEFFERTDLLKAVFKAELIHLIYIVPVALLSLFMPFTWKGRKLTHG